MCSSSGRSMKSYKLPESHIRKHWNLNDTDLDTEQILGEYLDECEVGDTWSTNSEEITCID